jgi:hypothetical protein
MSAELQKVMDKVRSNRENVIDLANVAEGALSGGGFEAVLKLSTAIAMTLQAWLDWAPKKGTDLAPGAANAEEMQIRVLHSMVRPYDGPGAMNEHKTLLRLAVDAAEPYLARAAKARHASVYVPTKETEKKTRDAIQREARKSLEDKLKAARDSRADNQTVDKLVYVIEATKDDEKLAALGRELNAMESMQGRFRTWFPLHLFGRDLQETVEKRRMAIGGKWQVVLNALDEDKQAYLAACLQAGIQPKADEYAPRLKACVTAQIEKHWPNEAKPKVEKAAKVYLPEKDITAIDAALQRLAENGVLDLTNRNEFIREIKAAVAKATSTAEIEEQEEPKQEEAPAGTDTGSVPTPATAPAQEEPKQEETKQEEPAPKPRGRAARAVAAAMKDAKAQMENNA